MPAYTVVKGDLLDAKEELILQQNNCVSVRPHGLSKAIAHRFPYADPYILRRAIGTRNMAIDEDRPIPGSIHVFSPPVGESGPAFVSLFAQYGMGRPYAYNNSGSDAHPDSHEDRLRWFESCLDMVASLQPKSVAMPYNIGCGLAGGNWAEYEPVIDRWAMSHPDMDVVLYHLV